MLEIYGYIIRYHSSNRMVDRSASGREVGWDAVDSHNKKNDYNYDVIFDDYPDGGIKLAPSNLNETYPPEFQQITLCDQYEWATYEPIDRDQYMHDYWFSYWEDGVTWQELFPNWPPPHPKPPDYSSQYYYDFFRGNIGNGWRTVDGDTKDGYGFYTDSGYEKTDNGYLFIDSSTTGDGYFNSSKYRQPGGEAVLFMLPSSDTSEFIYPAALIADNNAVYEGDFEWGAIVEPDLPPGTGYSIMFNRYTGSTEHMVDTPFVLPNHVEPGWHTFTVGNGYSAYTCAFQLDLKVKLFTSEGERDFTFTTDYVLDFGEAYGEYRVGDEFLKIFIGQVNTIDEAFVKNFKS